MKIAKQKKIKNPTSNYNKELEAACLNNNLDSVKEILLSNQSKKHKYAQDFLDDAVFAACMQGHLNIVKYLLESQELIINADIYSYKSRSFKLLAMKNDTEIMEYLIFDYKIKKTPEIHSECILRPKYEEMFKLKDNLESKIKMTKELEHHLPKNDVQSKKHKI